MILVAVSLQTSVVSPPTEFEIVKISSFADLLGYLGHHVPNLALGVVTQGERYLTCTLLGRVDTI
jgi:hypothetical protein